MDTAQYKFDEADTVKFIRKELPKDVDTKYDDDEILCIIDLIWDYYERKGLLSLNIDETEDEQLDPDDLIKYVKNEVKNDDDLIMDPKDIDLIVKAELDYEESLENFF